jgi:hypothetical protein
MPGLLKGIELEDFIRNAAVDLHPLLRLVE